MSTKKKLTGPEIIVELKKHGYSGMTDHEIKKTIGEGKIATVSQLAAELNKLKKGSPHKTPKASTKKEKKEKTPKKKKSTTLSKKISTPKKRKTTKKSSIS